MTSKVAIYEIILKDRKPSFIRWVDRNDIVHIISGVIILRPGKYVIDFSFGNANKVTMYTSNEYGDLLSEIGTKTSFFLDITTKTKYVIRADDVGGKNYMTVTKQPEEIKIEDEYTIIE